MSLSFTLEENGLYVEISGDIDHHSAKVIREEIDRATEKYLPDTLYLDLSQVTFMDSSGIGLVLGRYKNMAKRKGEVAVVVPSGKIKQILIMAATDKFVKFYDTKPV